MGASTFVSRVEGGGGVVLRSSHGRLSARVHTRPIVVTATFLVLAFVMLCWSLSVGDFPIPIGDVLAALVGRGSEDNTFIVRTLRMPRGLTALLVGAGFGVAGAILQRVSRNPLSSPDMIGINAGAACAAVFVIVVLHGTSTQVTAGALTGSAVTAIALYLLSYKNGVTGYRFVLVGIGLFSVLTALTQYLLTRAQIYDARRATLWMTGSLNGRDWQHVRQMGIVLAVLLPIALALAASLQMLEFGDDAATGLGVRVERARGGLIAIAVALAAVGTATAGPIGFVALVAPQIACRVAGVRTAGILPAAACGALLLAASDLVARRAFAPRELPVGVITAILGAPYLLYLLARSNKIGRSG